MILLVVGGILVQTPITEPHRTLQQRFRLYNCYN